MAAARLRTIVLLIVVLLSKLLILLITMLLILLITRLILLLTMLILLITALPQDSRLLFTLLLADHLQSLPSSADSWNQFFKLDLLTILVKRHQQYRFFNNDNNSSGMEAIQQDFVN